MKVSTGVSRLDSDEPCDIECCIAQYNEISSDFILASSIMIILTLALLPIFIFMTIKVSRMVWSNDKAVPLTLMMMCITLLSMVLYYTWLMVYMKNPRWICTGTNRFRCV